MRKFLFWRKVRKELFSYHLMVAETAYRYGIAGILTREVTKFCRSSAANVWRAKHSR